MGPCPATVRQQFLPGARKTATHGCITPRACWYESVRTTRVSLLRGRRTPTRGPSISSLPGRSAVLFFTVMDRAQWSTSAPRQAGDRWYPTNRIFNKGRGTAVRLLWYTVVINYQHTRLMTQHVM